MNGREAGTLSRTVYDVAVVGAGPAGSVAALLCARAGLHTILVDRADFPRPKPCGDCLSPELTRVLDRHDLLQCVLDARPAKLAGWRIVSAAGNSFEGRFCDISDDPRLRAALAISRDRLDAVLVDAAVRAGVELVVGFRVTNVHASETPVRIDGRCGSATIPVRARFMIGADGLRSVVARAIGAVRPARRRLRKISLTAHVTGVRDVHDVGEMHVARGLCLGIAAVNSAASSSSITPGDLRDGPPVWNVTLVADAERFGRAIASAPARFHAHALSSFPALGRRLDGMQPVGPPGRGRDAWLLRSGPFDVPTRRTISGNVLLAGDAAGYYDPFTGQGLFQAISDAERVATAITTAIRERTRSASALRDYARDLQRRRRGPRFLQHVIEGVMSRPRIASPTIAWLAERPGLVNALLAATGDMAPVSSLLRPSVLNAFVRSPEPLSVA